MKSLLFKRLKFTNGLEELLSWGVRQQSRAAGFSSASEEHGYYILKRKYNHKHTWRSKKVEQHPSSQLPDDLKISYLQLMFLDQNKFTFNKASAKLHILKNQFLLFIPSMISLLQLFPHGDNLSPPVKAFYSLPPQRTSSHNSFLGFPVVLISN